MRSKSDEASSRRDEGWNPAAAGGVVVGKKTSAYRGRCQQDTRHKRGRRGRWHCLMCGTHNVALGARAQVKKGLPPGFLVEKRPNGQLGLYMATPLGDKAHEKKVMHYLKGVFASGTTRTEIESHAWSVYRALKSEPERG